MCKREESVGAGQGNQERALVLALQELAPKPLGIEPEGDVDRGGPRAEGRIAGVRIDAAQRPRANPAASPGRTTSHDQRRQGKERHQVEEQGESEEEARQPRRGLASLRHRPRPEEAEHRDRQQTVRLDVTAVQQARGGKQPEQEDDHARRVGQPAAPEQEEGEEYGQEPREHAPPRIEPEGGIHVHDLPHRLKHEAMEKVVHPVVGAERGAPAHEFADEHAVTQKVGRRREDAEDDGKRQGKQDGGRPERPKSDRAEPFVDEVREKPAGGREEDDQPSGDRCDPRPDRQVTGEMDAPAERRRGEPPDDGYEP